MIILLEFYRFASQKLFFGLIIFQDHQLILANLEWHLKYKDNHFDFNPLSDQNVGAFELIMMPEE